MRLPYGPRLAPSKCERWESGFCLLLKSSHLHWPIALPRGFMRVKIATVEMVDTTVLMEIVAFHSERLKPLQEARIAMSPANKALAKISADISHLHGPH